MFGLEDQKKDKKPKEFVFELEKEFQDPVKGKKLKELLESRIGELRRKMREGEDKENYDLHSELLAGYISVVKVMIRSIVKK